MHAGAARYALSCRVVTPPTDEDSILFHRWLGGDEQAFRRFFVRTAPFVHAIARRSGLTASDADDVVQRVFVAVHLARGDFRRGSRVMPWIGGITRNVVHDQLRRAGRRREAVLDEALDLHVEAREHGVEDVEALEAWLRDALERLPETSRGVLVLHFFERLSFAECGAKLGCSEGAARVRAHRGYQQLRAWLAERPA